MKTGMNLLAPCYGLGQVGKLAALAKMGTPVWAIVNPWSGPGPKRVWEDRAAWGSAMRRLGEAGARVFLYVDAEQGAGDGPNGGKVKVKRWKTAEELEKEVGIYEAFYPGAKGVFVDDARTDVLPVLKEWMRGKAMKKYFVLTNPGAYAKLVPGAGAQVDWETVDYTGRNGEGKARMHQKPLVQTVDGEPVGVVNRSCVMALGVPDWRGAQKVLQQADASDCLAVWVSEAADGKAAYDRLPGYLGRVAAALRTGVF